MHGLVPPLGACAWRLLAGFAPAQLGLGLTLPFLVIYLHDLRGFPLPTAGLALGLEAIVPPSANRRALA